MTLCIKSLKKSLRLIFVRVKCTAEVIHALIESERDHLKEIREKLRKVTAHCSVVLKDACLND